MCWAKSLCRLQGTTVARDKKGHRASQTLSLALPHCQSQKFREFLLWSVHHLHLGAFAFLHKRHVVSSTRSASPTRLVASLQNQPTWISVLGLSLLFVTLATCPDHLIIFLWWTGVIITVPKSEGCYKDWISEYTQNSQNRDRNTAHSTHQPPSRLWFLPLLHPCRSCFFSAHEYYFILFSFSLSTLAGLLPYSATLQGWPIPAQLHSKLFSRTQAFHFPGQQFWQHRFLLHTWSVCLTVLYLGPKQVPCPLTSVLWLALSFPASACLGISLYGRKSHSYQGWPFLIFRLQRPLVWFWRSDSILTLRKAVHPRIIFRGTFAHCRQLKPISFQVYKRLTLPPHPKCPDGLAFLWYWFYCTEFGYFKGQHRSSWGIFILENIKDTACAIEGHCILLSLNMYGF